MKRTLLYIFLGLCTFIKVGAQEVEGDSLAIRMEGVKNFDGFLLDMSLMPSLRMPAPYLPQLSLLPPDASKDFSYLFKLDDKATYTQGATQIFTRNGNGLYPTSSFGATENLQMGSFRLKNGMRLNTYGQYDKNGRRVFNPSAMPWERNDFKGAFELKSANGNFGIRIEVEQKR